MTKSSVKKWTWHTLRIITVGEPQVTISFSRSTLVHGVS